MEEDVTEQIATLMIRRSDREGVNHPRVEEDDKFKDTSIQWDFSSPHSSTNTDKNKQKKNTSAFQCSVVALKLESFKYMINKLDSNVAVLFFEAPPTTLVMGARESHQRLG